MHAAAQVHVRPPAGVDSRASIPLLRHRTPLHSTTRKRRAVLQKHTENTIWRESRRFSLARTRRPATIARHPATGQKNGRRRVVKNARTRRAHKYTTPAWRRRARRARSTRRANREEKKKRSRLDGCRFLYGRRWAASTARQRRIDYLKSRRRPGACGERCRRTNVVVTAPVDNNVLCCSVTCVRRSGGAVAAIRVHAQQQ